MPSITLAATNNRDDFCYNVRLRKPSTPDTIYQWKVMGHQCTHHELSFVSHSFVSFAPILKVGVGIQHETMPKGNRQVEAMPLQ